MQPNEDIQLIFTGMTMPTPTCEVSYKADVPEDLKKKITENVELFLNGKPYEMTMDIRIKIKYDA